MKMTGVPAIDGLTTNWGRKADGQAECATALRKSKTIDSYLRLKESLWELPLIL